MRTKHTTPINERATLTRQMAADYLSISVSTFKTFELAGDIRGFAIGSGKEKRYRRSELDSLIDRIEAGEAKAGRTVAK